MTREQEILLKMAKKALSADTSSDLISRADAIEAIQNAYCKPCKERGDDYNEVRCRACEYDNAIIQIDALPSADTEPKWNCTATFVAEQLDKLKDMSVSKKLKLIQDLLGVEFKEENLTLPSAKLNNPCDSLLTDESNGSKEHKSKLDLISRADAVKAIMSEPMNKPHYPIWFANKLKELPSAEAVSKEEHVKALNDLAVAWKNKLDEESYEKGYTAGQFADRPKGEWIPHTTSVGLKHYAEYARCSECGEMALVHMNFCPNCGAKMKGGDSE